MITRKHYNAIAKILCEQPSPGYINSFGDTGKTTRCLIANKMASYFAKDNPRFNRQKFLDACGLNEGLKGSQLWTGAYEPDLQENLI